MNAPAAKTVEVAVETMGGDLLAALVDEVRMLPDVWPKIPEVEQAEVIERLRKRVTHNVREAVMALAADGRVTIAADLESVTFRDGFKATLKFEKNAAGKHDLIDVVGQPVLVVLANPEDYMGGVGEVKADSDQRALDLDQAAQDVIHKARRRKKGRIGDDEQPDVT